MKENHFCFFILLNKFLLPVYKVVLSTYHAPNPRAGSQGMECEQPLLARLFSTNRPKHGTPKFSRGTVFKGLLKVVGILFKMPTTRCCRVRGEWSPWSYVVRHSMKLACPSLDVLIFHPRPVPNSLQSVPATSLTSSTSFQDYFDIRRILPELLLDSIGRNSLVSTTRLTLLASCHAHFDVSKTATDCSSLQKTQRREESGQLPRRSFSKGLQWILFL